MVTNKKLSEVRASNDLVPQTIVKGSLEKFAAQGGIPLEDGIDDLDHYRGFGGSVDGTDFAVMRYAGHPENTFTIYLPMKVNDLVDIVDLTAKIGTDLGITDSLITWHRKDNPEL